MPTLDAVVGMLAMGGGLYGRGPTEWSAFLAAAVMVAAVIVFPMLVGLVMRFFDRGSGR